MIVRGLPAPRLLIQLIEDGRWRHPGEAALTGAAPWFLDQLDFLTDVNEMERRSHALDQLHQDEASADLFHLARSQEGSPVTLPWLDIDNAVLIAVCRHTGDDTAVALDYRTDPADPRVLAGDCWTNPARHHWRTVSPTFSAFVDALGLTGPSHSASRRP